MAIASAIAIDARLDVAPGQSRDNATAPAGTASISGTVLVAENKQPARRTRVTLTNLARTSPGQTTTTDDRGAFMFANLPAGRFELHAFKPAYLRGSYGATRPERAGTAIVVADGQAVAGLTIAIARGGVISGVVRDLVGQPLPGLPVRVLKFSYHALTGERTLGAPSSASTVVTDDRGEYRAFGLPPGGYVVMMSPPVSGRVGGPGVDDIRQLTSAEVQQAIQMARSGAGGLAAPLAAPAASTTRRVNYAPVFHPGVTDIASATTIALGVSEEKTGVDVTVRLVPSATISGTISSASGAPLPASLTVRLVPAGTHTELLAGAGLRGPSTMPRPDGSFVFGGVAPGAYRVKAAAGGASGGRSAGPLTDVPTIWAAADVNVTGQDVHVPLVLQPGVPINGRVVFEGATPTADELQALQFRLLPPGAGGELLYSGGGRVNAEGRFSFAAVIPEPYQFVFTSATAGAGEKWSIKSSIANGRDAYEGPLRVNPNEPVEWTVTFTDKPTTLAGVLQDRSGRAATDYFILVYSADRTHWTAGSRRVRMTRPATDGAFSAKGLPPGEYLVAALTDLEPGEWNDPTLLEQLAASSVKVSLRLGEITRQDFRISR